MGRLLAGAAKRDITPMGEMLEKLNAVARDPFAGIGEHIYFRAIAVSDGEETAILAGYDLIIAPFCDAMTKALQEKYGIKPENCVFAGTHNHDAVELQLREGNDWHAMMNGRTPSDALAEYSEWVFGQVLDAVDEAIKAMKPAKVGYKIGESYINACRDLPTPFSPVQSNNFHGPSDHSLTVVRFDDLEGNTIALFTNHATHSNMLVTNGLDPYKKLDSDVGGRISTFVERANCNKFPVIWAIGAAGDQNPIVRQVWRIVSVDDNGVYSVVQKPFPREVAETQLDGLCFTQGLEIIELCKAVDNFTEEVSFKGADRIYKVPERKSYSELKLFTDRNGTDCNQNFKPGERPEPVPTGNELQMRFRLFRLNDEIAFASFNGEAYSNLGLLAKEIIPAKATVFCEVSFGMCGYVPDEETEKYNGFGTCMSHVWSGKVANETFTKAFTALTADVYGK